MPKGAVLRLFAGLWCAVLIGLMGTGTLTNARIGEMTSGPEHDIISAAIAISQINFGLSGRLAYHEVAKAIAEPLLNGKDAWSQSDAADDANLQDPAKVANALKRGAAVKLSEIKIPHNRAGYLTDWCEDLGYAEFYDLAFRLFGVSAFSTHWLYISILSISVLLFISQFYRDDMAMGSLTLAISALFLTAQSDIFTKFIPSFAANRFLSTLALVPLLHVIHSALRQDRIRIPELIALLMQIFLMIFAITLRSSAEWVLIALLILLGALLYFRRDRSAVERASGSSPVVALRRMLHSLAGRRPAIVAALVALVLVEVGVVRSHQFDARYYWEDNLPHHFLWHSAYVGLSIDPQWPLYKPYADLPDGGDGVGFGNFAHHMDAQGKSPNSTLGDVPGWILARPYEDFIRTQYFDFLQHHIIYSLRLFFYDKPLGTIQDLSSDARAIFSGKGALANGLIFVISVALGGVLFSAKGQEASRLLPISMAVFLCSLAPLMWAYPLSFVVADQDWALLFMGAMACALSIAKIYDVRHEMRWWRTI